MQKVVLIVEDDLNLQRITKSVVESLGYQSIIAMNGEQALDKFKEKLPDLILLDIVMPLKSGFEFLEIIRIKEKSNVPVIILSNLSESQDIEKGKTLGVIDYIVKSDLTLEDIKRKIKNILNKKLQ